MKANEIIEEARKIAGLEDFDSYSFVEGLETALLAIDRNASLTAANRSSLYSICIRPLIYRLNISNYIAQNPEILSRPVTAPVFILGLPRTGSTLLSYLLGTDPKRRSMLRWELIYPIPPASRETLKSDPRCVQLVAEQKNFSDPLKHIHYEPFDGPTECHFVLAQDFKSSGLETPLASPIYLEWLLSCDTTDTYLYHKKFLQVLQSNAPGTWNLKLPSHALNIRSLLKVYPDARVIWMHRDPYEALPSFMQMATIIHRNFRDIPDFDYIRKYIPLRLHEHVRRLMAVQDEHEHDPFYHIFYNDLVKDPMSEIQKLYAWLGDSLEPTVRTEMELWLRENPKNKHGDYTYDLSTYDLTRDQLRPYFEDYSRRFDLQL